MLLVAWSTWNLNNAFTGRTDSSHEHCFYLQGDFFNWASPENVSRLAPPINPSTGPPLNLLRMRITKHLDFFLSLGGGQSGTLTLF